MKNPKTLSYAAWNPENIGDLEWPLKHKKKNPRWIIVGLNPSKPVSFPENFHKGGNDSFHKAAFTQNNVKGVPMLDLVDEVNPDSRVIVKKWRENPRWRKKQIRRFIAEMKSLFGKYKPKLLCIGKNTRSLFHKAPELNVLFSQLHAASNPNGIWGENRKQRYTKVTQGCTSGSCECEL
jgi:hypothetical protein